jgi:hypothetical protein
MRSIVGGMIKMIMEYDECVPEKCESPTDAGT